VQGERDRWGGKGEVKGGERACGESGKRERVLDGGGGGE